MKLSQAIKYFGAVHAEGWNGAAWEPLFLYGDLLSYDRFIGPRTFGHKQRIFLLGGDEMIPSAYEYIRLPTGKRYLILSYNSDFDASGYIGTAYIIQEVPYDAQVITMDSTPAPSGLGGTLSEVAGPTIFCDIERYSSEGSSEFDAVKYASHTVLIPLSTVIDTDNEIEVDGERYEIREVNHMLNVKQLRTIKRGTAP